MERELKIILEIIQDMKQEVRGMKKEMAVLRKKLPENNLLNISPN